MRQDLHKLASACRTRTSDDVDYLQQYASLRHREDQRLDAMAFVLATMAAAGVRAPPYFQTLTAISWQPEDSTANAMVLVEGRTVRFVHNDCDGDPDHEITVGVDDESGLTAAARITASHVLDLFDTG